MKWMAIYVVAILSIPTFAQADKHWECRDGSKGKCLVSTVEVHVSDKGSSNDNYVHAKLADPDAVTGCSVIRVSESYHNGSQMTISMAESILMTALTTGMPIMFKTEQSSGYCYAEKLIVTRP